MARTKNKYTPKPFESVGGNKLSANIYATMIQSDAWSKLSKNARLLYVYMKMQYYGQRPIPEHPAVDFVFNWALVSKTYKLYSNYKRFENDRNMLIEYGFIELIENGKNTRTKSIYRFSDKWQGVR